MGCEFHLEDKDKNIIFPKSRSYHIKIYLVYLYNRSRHFSMSGLFTPLENPVIDSRDIERKCSFLIGGRVKALSFLTRFILSSFSPEGSRT